MSFVTVDFPDIRESDSAEYAYLANVYSTTYSHNQNAWRSPDENRLDGTTYAAWWLMDEYYTRGEHAMIGECRMAESDHDRVSVYRMGLECVTKAYDKVFDRLGEAD